MDKVWRRLKAGFIFCLVGMALATANNLAVFYGWIEAPVHALPVVGQLVTPAPVARPTDCGELGTALATIREKESTGRYDAQNPTSPASGAYQFMPGTWAGYGGFANAKDAPSAVQDAKATERVRNILASQAVEDVPGIWYLGHPPTAAEWDVVPKGGNTLTPRQYQREWMDIYRRLFTPCPELAAPLPVIALPLGGHHHTSFPALDLPATRGTQFVAIAGGTVSFVGGSCGEGISIEDHGTSWKYCHADRRLVSEGDVVAPGAPLGLIGMTGETEGPHLHLELETAGSMRCPQALVETLVTHSPSPPLDSLPTAQPCPGR